MDIRVSVIEALSVLQESYKSYCHLKAMLHSPNTQDSSSSLLIKKCAIMKFDDINDLLSWLRLIQFDHQEVSEYQSWHIVNDISEFVKNERQLSLC